MFHDLAIPGFFKCLIPVFSSLTANYVLLMRNAFKIAFENWVLLDPFKKMLFSRL